MKMNYAAMMTELAPKWREVFEKAVTYANLNNIDTSFADERLTDLFDLLVTAQSEDKSVRKITGGNIELFCKDYFSDYTPVERLKTLPKILFRLACIMSVIELIGVIGSCDKFSDIWDARSNVAGYLIGIAVSVVFEIINIFVITPCMLRSKSTNNWTSASLGIFILLFAGSIILASKLELFSALTAPSVWLIICSVAYAAIYFIVRSVWRYRNFGTIFDTRRRMEKELYFRSLNDANAEAGILKGWSIRYRRLSKKGKVTEETFLDKVRSDTALTHKLNKLYFPLYAIIWGCGVIKVATEGSGVSDTLFFAVICGFAIWAVHRLFIRWYFVAEANMDRLIAECEKSGDTLPAFIEKKMNTEEE